MSVKSTEKPKTSPLGTYLESLRSKLEMSLRDVEEATENQVSNAYLSQLETGKITKPSPNILHALSKVYGAPYAKLMEKAGYIAATNEKNEGKKHGKAATFAIENLSAEEEEELLKYLTFVRSKWKNRA